MPKFSYHSTVHDINQFMRLCVVGVAVSLRMTIHLTLMPSMTSLRVSPLFHEDLFLKQFASMYIKVHLLVT